MGSLSQDKLKKCNTSWQKRGSWRPFQLEYSRVMDKLLEKCWGLHLSRTSAPMHFSAQLALAAMIDIRVPGDPCAGWHPRR
jgi:hypothetical protein